MDTPDWQLAQGKGFTFCVPGATFEVRRVYFAGEARGDELMSLQLDVYRAVRFAEDPEESRMVPQSCP